MPSRWSDGPSPNQHQRYGSRGGGGGDSFSGGGGGRHHPYRGDGPPDYPSGGGGGPGFRHGPGGYGQQMPMGGQRRGGGRGGGGFSGSGRGGSPDDIDASNFAKLFVGSVPRTATEEDIRPLFEEHGSVIEVALIKDKRTGQQQGCCFIKYATSEEADRAIRALHNQYTLPGGHGPIQVRFADGERERLGAVEYKLFVGSLNKQATEREVEEIFSPYGRVEDVYIMKDELKQSRGCGFVKFSHREMAAAAINALSGIYTMRGCDQPLTVRFADPKRPRPGESRGGPAFGGPGFGPRSQPPLGVRPTPNLGEPASGRLPPNAWHPISPQSHDPSSQVSTHGNDNNVASKGGVSATSSSASGYIGALGGPTNGSLPGLALTPSSMPQQGFNPSAAQVHSIGQQISPFQKPLLSPQHLPPSLQLHPHQQTLASYSQAQGLQAPMQQLGQLQIPHSGGLPSFSQALPSQQLIGLGGQLPTSQQSSSSASLQVPSNLQQQGIPASANQQQLSASNISHHLLQQPVQQSPTQVMLQQQAQSLQSTFQSTQQAFSQLQQQLQLMQPSLSQQQSSQTTKQQSPWAGTTPHSVSSTPTVTTAVVPSTVSATSSLSVSTLAAAPLTCNWTEHTSPEGYKYYYNSVTKESKWEKPEELTLFEQQQHNLQLHQQQQQQKSAVQQLQSQSQAQPHTQVQPTQQISQIQQVQPQMQLRQQASLQLLQPSLSYQASGSISNQNMQDLNYAQLQVASTAIDPVRVQQGLQAAQEWMWKNKPAGT